MKLPRHTAPVLAGAFLVLFMFGRLDAALADCTPAAVANVVATCTGTTVNQQLNAPGTSVGTQGYGGSTIVNANVTVTPGASVTGTQSGVRFNSGVVVNNGNITGTSADGVQSTTTLTLTNTGTVTATAGSAVHATTATITNSGIFLGGVGITANTSAVITNSGSITGTISAGIVAPTTVTLTNTGTVRGNTAGVNAGTIATVNNAGSITGGTNGITAGSGVITNTGSIAGTANGGIVTNTTLNLSNGGTISGGVVGVAVGGAGTVTTSGTIVGSGGTAIQFNRNGTAAADTLTVLAGARFGGVIDFGGGADTLNLPGTSLVLNTVNLDTTLSTINAGGSPVIVSGGRVVVASLAGFGASDRALMDITGWMASVLPGGPAPEQPPAGSDAFAAIDAAAPDYDSAFGSFPAGAMAYQPTKAPLFKSATVSYADGSSVWAKGFGGRRQQSSDGGIIGSTTTGYGGAFGYERGLAPGLNIGALFGASTNKTSLDQNSGDNNNDAVFAGLYARLTRGATFLDLSLIGGQLDNTSTRNIAVGLGTETARATYKGYFINPALTLGHSLALGQGYSLTPALKVRYVAARFDGYSETGSSANLTVDGRTVRSFEERGELTLARTAMLGGHRVTARVSGGVLGQQQIGGSIVNAALLGQTFAASAPGQNSVSGYFGGAGLDWQIGRLALFASGETTATNNGTRTYVGQGGVRIAW